MGALILAHDLLGTGAVLLLGPRRRFRHLVNAELALLLAFSLAYHVVLGGFMTSAGIILWAFLAPVAALLMLDARNSRGWFLLFLAVVAAATLADPLARPPEPPATSGVPTLSFAFNLLMPVLLAYLSLRLVFGEREQALLGLELEREAAERERATLEAIMGSMSEGLVVCDREGRIRYASNQMPELMPADPSAGPVRRIDDWLAGVAAAVESPEELERLRAALLSAGGGGGDGRASAQPAGGPAPAGPRLLAAGSPVGAAGTLPALAGRDGRAPHGPGRAGGRALGDHHRARSPGGPRAPQSPGGAAPGGADRARPPRGHRGSQPGGRRAARGDRSRPSQAGPSRAGHQRHRGHASGRQGDDPRPGAMGIR